MHNSETDRSVQSSYWDFRADRYSRIYSSDKKGIEKWVDWLLRQAFRKRLRATFNYLRDLNGKSVLDMGCGTGEYMIEAIGSRAKIVVGVDFSKRMLEISRMKLRKNSPIHERWKLIHADIINYHIKEAYDVVLFIGVLEYLDFPGKTLKLLRRSTDNTLICTFSRRFSFISRFRYGLLKRKYGLRLHLHSKRQVKDMVLESGFLIVTIKKIGPTWWMVLRPLKATQDRK